MEKTNSDGSARQLELKNCKQCGAFYPENGAIDLCIECLTLYDIEVAGKALDAYEGEEHHGG